MSTICDDLRAAILQAAMQGKLTKQLPEDGDAKDLLERIKAKKATKRKVAKTITEHDQLFDIPSSWQWARFGEIVDFNMGKTPPRAEASYWGNDIPWISIADMPDGEVLLTTKEKISNKAFVDKFKSKICPKETLIMSFKLTVGRCSILGIDAVYNEAIISINPVIDDGFAFRNYLKNMLPYLSNYGETKDAIKGRTLNSDSLNNLLIPVPPLAEQKRIVKKVDELMARVTDLEKSADALASLKSHYPDEMRASLLQAAMQGKLTKQLPEDGNAEDLLEEIKAEKEKLIAEGKIKKQKPLASIIDDETPFSIPENWKWTRLADLFQFINGDRGKNYPSKNKLHASGEIPFISAINMQNGTIREDNLLYADKPTYDKLGSGKLNKDDFVICIRGSLGKYCKYPYKLGAIASSLIIARKYSGHILDDYIEAYLQSPLLINEIHDKDNGTAQPNLSAADFMNFLIPIPPFAEQKRIAERLGTLMQNINVVGDLIASE